MGDLAGRVFWCPPPPLRKETGICWFFRSKCTKTPPEESSRDRQCYDLRRISDANFIGIDPGTAASPLGLSQIRNHLEKLQPAWSSLKEVAILEEPTLQCIQALAARNIAAASILLDPDLEMPSDIQRAVSTNNIQITVMQGKKKFNKDKLQMSQLTTKVVLSPPGENSLSQARANAISTALKELGLALKPIK